MRPKRSTVRKMRARERGIGLPRNDAAARWLRQHDPARQKRR